MGVLSPKQAGFVREYLVDKNATQAAIRAGYSHKTAEQQGCRLLRNAKVRAAVDAALAEQIERVNVRADDVLRELMRLGLADPAACFDADGEPLPLHKMPKEARAFIAGVDYEELWEGHGEGRVRLGNIRKLKFWSKPEALKMLGQHLKLFVEKVSHEHAFSALTDEQLQTKLQAILSAAAE